MDIVDEAIDYCDGIQMTHEYNFPRIRDDCALAIAEREGLELSKRHQHAAMIGVYASVMRVPKDGIDELRQEHADKYGE